MTKFRTGLLLGLAVGYYFGAQAGKERYDQLNALFRRALQTDALDQVLEFLRSRLVA